MKSSIDRSRILCLGSSVLLERSVDLDIQKAYSELRTILLEKGCKIVSEKTPTYISIEQGSLRGVLPKSAKKVVSYRISPCPKETQILGYSSVSSDWARLTLWGNILAGIVALIFWWIAADITALVIDGSSRYWTWLAGAFGYPNVQYVFFMINVTKVLSIVLVVTILLEILDVLIVYRKIDSFATETLDELEHRQSSLSVGLN